MKKKKEHLSSDSESVWRIQDDLTWRSLTSGHICKDLFHPPKLTLTGSGSFRSGHICLGVTFEPIILSHGLAWSEYQEYVSSRVSVYREVAEGPRRAESGLLLFPWVGRDLFT